MTKTRKRYVRLLTAVLLVGCVCFSNFKTAFAWDAHLNDANDVEIITVDRKKTGNIWYYTKGVTVTRCQYNPAKREIHSNGQWFGTDLDNPVKDQGTSTITNVFTLKMEDIIANAYLTNASWGKEIEDAYTGNGPACYVKLDCIMYVVDETNGRIELGDYVNAPGKNGGDGNSPTGIDKNGREIKDAYAWGNPNGLLTHYNHYLLIGKDTPTNVIQLDDEFVTYDYTMDHYANIDENVPTYATGNSSGSFDLSNGIPSSEYIDNRYLADSWYGNTNVYARTVSKDYSWTMYYYWYVPDGYWNTYIETTYDEWGNEVNTEKREWIDTSYWTGAHYEIPIGTAYVAFQYLADTNIYDFTGADIGNECFEADHIFYDDSREVPVTCISSSEYKELGTGAKELIEGEINWYADTSKHVSFAKSINYQTSRRLSSASEVTSAIMADREAIRAQISANCKTRNDRLTIDGHSFMKNDWVSGANFFDEKPTSYKSCTKSSAVVNNYLLNGGERPLHAYDPADVTGASTVQIPATVDNGYYYSTMQVNYQKVAPYKKTLSYFFAGEQ